MKNFDINKISKGKSRNIKIGELSKEVIALLDLDLNPQNINIWSTRIEEHCKKHKDEYSSPSAYNQAIMDFGAIQCTPQSPNCMFCPLADSCSALSKGQVMQLPVKQHRTKTSNRYFNYIYVRMGACTFIHKRTADDIWKNLFELPLVETDRNLSEEEFLSSASFRSLIAEGEVPEVRLVFRNVKHVLSHRVIYANFYEVVLPENSRSFSEYQCIRMEDLEQYPVSRLVHAFLEKYL